MLAVTDVLDVLGGTGKRRTRFSGAFGTGLTTGTDNVAIGENAGDALTTGSDNTFVGDEAGGATTTGSNNVAIGSGAADANTTGAQNTAVGEGSLSQLIRPDLTTRPSGRSALL